MGRGIAPRPIVVSGMAAGRAGRDHVGMSADGERLAFDDVQILKLESAAIRGHTGKLTVIEPDDRGRGLAPEDLRERIAARIDRAPRLRQRVAMPRFSSPRWEEDPDFDLARHVAVVPDAESLDEEGLRARVGELMSQRLDHERPLWRLDLLPVQGGRTAIVARVHHCMADGVSSMKLLAGILWDPGSDAPGEGHRPAVPTPGPPGRGAAGGRREARGPLATIAKLPGTLRRELRRGPGPGEPARARGEAR
jgi:diacylglycerol O-acyltransferase / wax synthase